MDERHFRDALATVAATLPEPAHEAGRLGAARRLCKGAAMQLDPTSRVRRADGDFVSTEIDGELVFMHLPVHVGRRGPSASPRTRG